jgi:RNA polymerase sigma-70 factor, ECF subfamily
MDATHQQNELEAQLLAKVARGDQSAFERLYHLYEKRVFHYICTLITDHVQAGDIVGETMLAIWRGARTFSGTSRVSTWIFGIARHKSLDAARKFGRQQREVNLEAVSELPNPQESPLEGAYRKQMDALTQRALATLSQEHREVLRLVFYEELPYQEIAIMLSIPNNTVKTRVYYAKQQLKLALERVEGKVRANE